MYNIIKIITNPSTDLCMNHAVIKGCLTLSRAIPGLYDPVEESFWKHCGKRRKCWSPAFSLFPTMFSTLSKTNLNFWVTFILSSANVLSLAESKMLSSGKEFIYPYNAWQPGKSSNNYGSIKILFFAWNGLNYRVEWSLVIKKIDQYQNVPLILACADEAKMSLYNRCISLLTIVFKRRHRQHPSSFFFITGNHVMTNFATYNVRSCYGGLRLLWYHYK